MFQHPVLGWADEQPLDFVNCTQGSTDAIIWRGRMATMGFGEWSVSMSDELWEYANKLSKSGDPDSLEVRGFVQRHEEDSAFQDMVGRINSLHMFQKQHIEAESAKKLARGRKTKP
jgi:hypothetical protein